MAFKVVDFPAPFPPITVTKSPSSRERFTPFNATFSLMVPGLNVFLILSIFNISAMVLLLLSFVCGFQIRNGKENRHNNRGEELQIVRRKL